MQGINGLYNDSNKEKIIQQRNEEKYNQICARFWRRGHRKSKIIIWLCKVIPKYAKNVNKNIIIEILQSYYKCRKHSKIKHLERF